jgi:molybdate transport system substrate-binding protein
LEHNELWQPLSKRLITGININQTFQQVRSQAVHFGLIANSQLVQNDLIGIDIPICQHQPIIQQLVILKASKKQLLAKQFIDYLLNESSQKKLSKMGYQAVASLSNDQC